MGLKFFDFSAGIGGFPDEYFERAAAVCSENQLYKQAGNSVTVNVIYEIAKRLKV